MSHAFDPSRRPQIALAPGSLHALRTALTADLGASAAGYLQEAGYATGVGHAAALREWLQERGEGELEALPLPLFQARVAEFFEQLGWGQLSLATDAAAVTVVDAAAWAEWVPRAPGEAPTAHFTTGMLAGFFGTLADHPLAVLEVEAPASVARGCRFLVGSAEALDAVYQRLQAGERYEQVLATLG
jgi:predicted hydrocarbon binding protein